MRSKRQLQKYFNETFLSNYLQPLRRDVVEKMKAISDQAFTTKEAFAEIGRFVQTLTDEEQYCASSKRISTIV